jgi:SAM-dependent methyltransferase
VFLYVLAEEEGEARDLHYGLFDRPDEPILVAQRRSTRLLLDRLPPPPARVLDVGMGLGETLAALAALGYSAEGITPDERQVALARARHGENLPARAAAFESFVTDHPYDVILFQESSQYIDSDVVFGRARELLVPGGAVVTLDEFSLRTIDRPGALHRLDRFLTAAENRGFRCEEDLDLSGRASPTIDYFLTRLPIYRDELIRELGLSCREVDALVESGRGYRDRYRSGEYGYWLLRFRRND